MSVYVGIDVHRKRSQVAVIDSGGEVLATRNVPNGVETILGVIGGLPPGTPAAFEAAYGWGWLAGLLEDYGFDPHLVHPLQCKAIASARLKNDKAGAAILAQLLRADLLPEAWIAPPAVRQLRALLRHRAQLVRLRRCLRNGIGAVLERWFIAFCAARKTLVPAHSATAIPTAMPSPLPDSECVLSCRPITGSCPSAESTTDL